MMFSEVITLITETSAKDSIGNVIPKETTKDVYANPFSMGSVAFNIAAQSGLRPECEFRIHAEDYDGQEIFEHKGTRYHAVTVSRKGQWVNLVGSRKVADE